MVHDEPTTDDVLDYYEQAEPYCCRFGCPDLAAHKCDPATCELLAQEVHELRVLRERER